MMDPLTVLKEQVQQALNNLDIELKRDYDFAKATAPDIVRLESREEEFLFVENNDPQRAAVRVARYWKMRKEAFGIRWLRRMDQTGNGALSKQDIDLLRTGYLVVLVRPSGGLLIIHDRSRLPQHYRGSCYRILFYLSSVFPEQSLHRTVILHVASSVQGPEIDLMQNPYQIYRSILPSGKIPPQMIVAQTSEVGKEHLVDFNAYRLRRTEEYRSNLSIERVVGNSPFETLQILEQYGLERNLIPNSLGGNFDYGKFDEWIQTRLQLEASIASTSSLGMTQKSSMDMESILGRIITVTQPSSQRTSPIINLPPLDTSADAQAKMPAVEQPRASSQSSVQQQNSRHYQRVNSQIANLQNQATTLIWQNSHLREHNKMLEHYLARARHLVACATTNQTDDDHTSNNTDHHNARLF